LNYLKKCLYSLPKHYKNNKFFDKNFLKGYTKKNAFSFLSKSWLIIRFDDKGFYKGLQQSAKKMRKKKEKGLFLLEGTEIGPQKEEETIKFLSIIDLFFLEKFSGSLSKTIILDSDMPSLFRWLFIHITAMTHGRTKHKEFDYFAIADRIEEIIEISKKIEKLSLEQCEKLLFAGETIRNVNNQRDAKMQFMMLISIIEFLLTHNPNISRFNVEDSIRQQFQLKAGIVISKDDKSKLDVITERLKTMYDVRSMIAHGNFSEFKKFIQKTKKNDKDFSIFDMVEELFNYISIIINTYIDEPKYIEALKKI